MSFSNYLENALAKHSMGIEAYPMPTNIYVALLTSDPGEGGDMTSEVSAVDYARRLSTPDFQVTNGIISNNVILDFPKALNDWGSISHVALCDASTAGNVLYYGELNAVRVINTDDVFAILAYDFNITLD